MKSNISGQSLRLGTRILTSEGVVNIETLENKFFKVRNTKGTWSYARCRKSDSEKSLQRITLANSKEYHCATEHKWPVIENTEPEVKLPVERHKADCDNILVDDLSTSPDKIKSAYESLGNKTEQPFKKSITKKLTININSNNTLPYINMRYLCDPIKSICSYSDGFCIGLLYSSNTQFVKDDGKKKYIWCLPKDVIDGDCGKILMAWMSDIDYSVIRTFEQTDSNGNEFVIITQRSKIFTEYMEKFGVSTVCDVNNKTYGVPEAVWTDSEDFRRGFIDSVYSINGNLTEDKLLGFISSTCETYVRDLWDLFGFYGINSTVKTTDKNSLPLVVFDADMFSYNFIVTDVDKQYELNKIKHRPYEPVGEIGIVDCTLTNLKEDVWTIYVYDETNMFSLSHCFT